MISIPNVAVGSKATCQCRNDKEDEQAGPQRKVVFHADKDQSDAVAFDVRLQPHKSPNFSGT